MIVTPDIYLNGTNMSIGVQFDPRMPVFPSVVGMGSAPHWMGSAQHQLHIKEEPRDEGGAEEQQQQQQRFQHNGGGLTLTPPPYSNSFQGITPPGDTPPASTPSPQNKEVCGGGGSSEEGGEYYEGGGDSIKRLQLAFQRSGITTEEKLQCPVCDFSCSIRSQFNEHLLSHETKCSMCDFNGENSEKLREHMKTAHDCDDDSWCGEDELSTPKVNSQGKIKTFRCKQCEFSAVTKLEFWEHSKIHIKQDRILNCPRCPFVTEYKHHLEYHLRNHFGSKPFKCDKCAYSCVNKSMLNSHLKSHSNVYQFRCADCNYATKYCHSLKLHLRKYTHKPAMVLNPDGTPNPLPVVDVFGTRRGPRYKPAHKQQQQEQNQAQASPPIVSPPATLFNPFINPYYNIFNSFGRAYHLPQDMNMEERNNNIEKEDVMVDPPLDLSCPEPVTEDGSQETPVTKNRRKGKAFKLEAIALRLQEQMETDEVPCEATPSPPPPQQTPAPLPPAPLPPAPLPPVPPKSPEVVKSCEADSEQLPEKPETKEGFICSYCDISFKDAVMHTIHMGYHGFSDPFQCNMCGEKTSDRVSFFLHIAKTSH